MTRFKVSLSPNVPGAAPAWFLIDGVTIEIVRGQVGAFVEQRLYTITDIAPLSDPHNVVVNGEEVSA